MAERRRYYRVALERRGRLRCGSRWSAEAKVVDLSLGGLKLAGDLGVEPGLECQLELREEGRHSCLILRFRVRVVWRRSDMTGLEFVSMDDDGYMLLQTMLLYSADDPLAVSNQFEESFAAQRQKRSTPA